LVDVVALDVVDIPHVEVKSCLRQQLVVAGGVHTHCLVGSNSSAIVVVEVVPGFDGVVPDFDSLFSMMT
jgi:hypothetical protein